MKKSIYLVIIFMTVFLTGCQSKNKLTTSDFSEVTAGMSASEVKERLGKPDEIEEKLERDRVRKQLEPFKKYITPMKDKITGGDELVEQLELTLEKIKEDVEITYYVYNYPSSSDDEETSVTLVFCDEELTLKLIEANFQNVWDTETTE